jgi:carbon-monoxide dehydrogenase small subunit
MAKQLITIRVNGERQEVAVEPNRTLLEMVREELGLTGAKEGCGTGDCGACSMILNGKLVTSCLVLAPEADGADVLTIEGMAEEGRLHPLQQAFIDQGALQCGFCIPGMLLAARALLESNPHPSRAEIRRGLAGNLCRCTGYTRMVDAVAAVAGRD